MPLKTASEDVKFGIFSNYFKRYRWLVYQQQVQVDVDRQEGTPKLVELAKY